MRVLVACEFSGVVREAFRTRGHEAWSCDFLQSDIPSLYHYAGNVLDILDRNWDLMIGHPPCTWLCAAMRTNAARKDRPTISSRFLEEREKAFAFVKTLYNAAIPKVAIENPIGYLNEAWRKPDCILRPFHFGHDYGKDICFWLKNLKPLQPTVALWPSPPYKKLDFYSTKRNPNGRSIKSITFPGVAKAMAEQWG